MRKYFVLSVIFIVSLGLSATAHAIEDGTVIANIPFDFIVAGKSMPAGTYTVARTSSGSELLVSNRNAGAFVIPIMFDNSPNLDPVLTFDKVSESYVLRQVNTPIGAFTLDTRSEEATLAQSKQHSGMTSSGGH
jgi:hypothetical protein